MHRTRTSNLICSEAEFVMRELMNPAHLAAYSPPAWAQRSRQMTFRLGEMELEFTYICLTGDWLHVRLGKAVEPLLHIARQVIANSPNLHTEVLKLAIVKPELTDAFIDEMLPEMREALVRAIVGVYDLSLDGGD